MFLELSFAAASSPPLLRFIVFDEYIADTPFQSRLSYIFASFTPPSIDDASLRLILLRFIAIGLIISRYAIYAGCH